MYDYSTLREKYFAGDFILAYYKADRLPVELSERFQRYKEPAAKKNLTDAECAKILELQMALDEIPDYLAPDFVSEKK